jgi:hypothetical protein
MPIALLGVLLGEARASVEIENGFTIGPVLNWSVGGAKVEFSYGINLAYWDFRSGTPWSINLGLETSRDVGRLFYSELQTGAILFGTSAGVVYSQTEGFGVQGSVWGNVFLGAQLRYRYLDGSRFVPGTYFAIPAVGTTGTLN